MQTTEDESEVEDWISVDENDDYKTVTITDPETGTVDYIQYNKNENTIYSSITGETVVLDSQPEPAEGPPSNARKAKTSTETKYISYAQIKALVGNTANASNVIEAILSLIPNTSNIGAAVSCIGVILQEINKNIPASKNHGIKLTIKVTKYYRTRMGRRQVYKVVREIVGAVTY
jgi:hypothetical protein